MAAYQHGGNAEAIAKSVGMSARPSSLLDFSVNVNPLGPPAVLMSVLLHGQETAQKYPEEFASSACRSLAIAHDLDPEQVVVGNGSTEIFGWILQSMRPRRAGFIAPCYGGYGEVCDAHGVPLVRVATLREEDGFAFSASLEIPEDVDVLFIGSPNNPTGNSVQRDVLLYIIKHNPACLFVIDVSFEDFKEPGTHAKSFFSDIPENVLMVKSLTKFFCIPGLRLGMGWGSTDTIGRIGAARSPWSVNALSQEVACKLFRNLEYVERSRLQSVSLRENFEKELRSIDELTVYPSDTNFLLVKLPDAWPAERLQKALLEQGILVRSCDNFEGLGANYCRLAVRPREEQILFIETLKDILSGGQRVADSHSSRRTPAIMVVGTTSNAGKSVVAAGLCRLLSRKGLSVAPFKAQNMALNSYVTAEGGEMGRAQVTQAFASGIKPHTDMNPVLLKPQGEDGSQVIVDGSAIGVYKARQYYAMKADMRRSAHEAYDRLAEGYDVIVLEGAGSPAEINLMAQDFVNMDMAAHAEAKTVLVADIDRGGVFASIMGTIALLPAAHRRLLSGVIINKFRGDVSLLDSGIREIESMTGVPVLGVLPYLYNLKIEDEDSLGLEARPFDADPILDVAVIRVPRISNFTDFMAMEHDEGIGLRYVESAAVLGNPDLIVLPGTKNTRADLEWMHETGMSKVIERARRDGTPIIGICGGYQMLGDAVHDPEGVEGEKGSTAGLGLLPISTTHCAKKELMQVAGTTIEAGPFCEGLQFSGYEIHAGRTDVAKGTTKPIKIRERAGQSVDVDCGAVSEDGNVVGCYVHGLFDRGEIRSALWRWLCGKKSVSADLIEVKTTDPMQEFDRLASILEQHVDLTGLIPSLH